VVGPRLVPANVGEVEVKCNKEASLCTDSLPYRPIRLAREALLVNPVSFVACLSQ